MKFALGLFAAVAFSLASAGSVFGALTVSSWHSEKLATVSSTSNEVYFWPDDTGAPTIFTTGSTGSYMYQTGGPLTWTAGPITTDTVSESGELFVFPPNTVGPTAALVHLVSGALSTRIYGGGVTTELPVMQGITGIRSWSCMKDASGNLHLAYGAVVDGTDYLFYTHKSATGAWVSPYYLPIGVPVTGTAVTATSLTASTIKIYYNYGSLGYSTLPNSGSILTSPIKLDGGGTGPIATLDNGSPGHLYYPRLANSTDGSLVLRDFDTTAQSASFLGTSTTGVVIPGTTAVKSIRATLGADSYLRVALFSTTNGNIYYFRNVDNAFSVAVNTTGAIANANLRGFMFTPGGNPVILYRNTLTDLEVAYPSEIADANNNGRPDLLDTALNSTTATMTVLDPVAPVDGISNSDNRFKVQFPVLGSPTGTGTTILKNAAKNLQYQIQTSADLENWFTETSTSVVKITVSGAVNAKVATAVFAETLPGVSTQKYARLLVQPITDDY